VNPDLTGIDSTWCMVHTGPLKRAGGQRSSR